MTEIPKRRRRSSKWGNRTEFIKFMLRKLGEKIIHRTDWEILCQPCSYSYFHATLKILLEEGYVERIERGVYRITDKGRKFVESI